MLSYQFPGLCSHNFRSCFHEFNYPSDIVDKLKSNLSGYNFTYGKRTPLKIGDVVDSMRDLIGADNPDVISPEMLDLEDRLMGVFGNPKNKTLRITSLHREEVEGYQWCHVANSFARDQDNAIVCFEPARKRTKVKLMDMSERYLGMAAGALGILIYEGVNAYHTPVANIRAFKKLFPKRIDHESVPRVFNTQIDSFMDEKYRRKKQKPKPEEIEKRKVEAKRFVGKAFDAFEIESLAMEVLRAEKPEFNWQRWNPRNGIF